MHKRINVTLPEETLRAIDRVAGDGQRSRLIDFAVRRFLRLGGLTMNSVPIASSLRLESVPQWGAANVREQQFPFPVPFHGPHFDLAVEFMGVEFAIFRVAVSHIVDITPNLADDGSSTKGDVAVIPFGHLFL